MVNKYIKYKRLQHMGKKSRAIIIPHIFLNELGWDKTTKLAVTFNPINKEVFIKEVGKWEPKEEPLEEVIIE